MELNFNGKRILVTGAGSGIGRAIAIGLNDAGASVVALSIIDTELKELNNEYPSIETIQADISQWNTTADAINQYEYFDGLVNCAAIVIPGTILDVTDEQFSKIMSVNVKGMLCISQIVSKKMIEKNINGSIVNISSQSSIIPCKDVLLYSCSKAAVDSITKSMASHLGVHNIRVNSLNPTATDTALLNHVPRELLNSTLSCIPLGRFAKTEDISNAVMFLLSDKASMINGVNLLVDGGYVASVGNYKL